MAVQRVVLSPEHWDAQYQSGPVVWDTGRPSRELRRVLATLRGQSGRALEIGCGSGTNAVYLAPQGFDVTAMDLSPVAVRRTRRRALAAGVSLRVLTADVTASAFPVAGPFDFFFDRGCYHAVRLADVTGYLDTIERVTRPGSFGLVLLGNADEPEDAVGPPVVEEDEIRAEWGERFDIVHLRPFRFDPWRPGAHRYLGWSCLVRRPG